MMKRWLILMLMPLMIAGCRDFEDLEIVGTPRFSVQGIKDNGIAFDLTLRIRNPNSQAFTVSGGNFKVKINGEEIGKARLTGKVRIEARRTGSYTFPVHASFNGKKISLDLIRAVISSGRFELDVNGKIRAGSFPLVQYPIKVRHNEIVDF